MSSGSPVRQPSWCQLGTVVLNMHGNYSLVPGVDRDRLERTLQLLEQQLRAEERALQQAERTAETADRKANTNRSRKTAPLFSTRRSMQSMRASLSDLSSTMAETSVQKHVREVERLYSLKHAIEDALLVSPLPPSLHREYVAPQSLAPTGTPRLQQRYCTSCGHKVEPEDSFCGDCGGTLRRRS